ncbi:hypothetical protein [Williamsia sterculiae]|uniref:Terminase small subunit n=1 Tax=Williamsia sterculiae TaxID=1344003 RepID=A0A1N7FC40_9NOCA|nr:hypothetical protein [Williamsia sterculiae]SIR97907.1 hypothetical protein SAMN05445060_1917 [Williamsia sterculiae]
MRSNYATLNAAMAAGDELAEAEIRYRLLAETFESTPQLRGNMNGQLERVKAEIVRLRALRDAKSPVPDPKVLPFDPSRFRKSGESTGGS